MTTEQVVEALKKMGFDHGWVVGQGQILLWEHDKDQPTQEELQTALLG